MLDVGWCVDSLVKRWHKYWTHIMNPRQECGRADVCPVVTLKLTQPGNRNSQSLQLTLFLRPISWISSTLSRPIMIWRRDIPDYENTTVLSFVKGSNERVTLDADFLTGDWVGGGDCLIATTREGQSVINDEYCSGPTRGREQGDVLLCGVL